MPLLGLGIGIADLFGGGAALGGIGADIASLFGLGEGAAAGTAAAAPAIEAGAATALPGLPAAGGTALPFAGGGASDLTSGALAFGDATPMGNELPAWLSNPAGIQNPAGGFPGISGATDASALTGTPAAPGTTTMPTGNIPADFTNTGGTVGPTAGGSVGTGAPGAAPTQSGNILDQLMKDPLGTLGQGAAKSVVNNPLGIALGAGALGLNLAQGSKSPLATAQGVALQQEAGQAQAQSNQLQSYLATGTLPPALQAQLDQATKAAKATAISQAAANGQSTDPKQNSVLAQTLSQIDNNAMAATANVQNQLLQTGIQEAGLSSQIYNFLLGIDIQQQQQLGKSIATFAGSFAPGIKIQTGSGTTTPLISTG